jgi:dTDP-4-amino-4,6-dideoxygalactose transaminase
MSYFFPGIIKSKEEFKRESQFNLFSVNSGEHAIRLLLKKFSLKQGSKVALPAFVCDSVERAIIDEGLRPHYLDLKSDGTFITDYNLDLLKREQISVVILVHLYGVKHPDNKGIEDYCIENKVHLIQDLAQSFGIEEHFFNEKFPIVYSFGPGKSSTAAGGAIITWKDYTLDEFKLKSPSLIDEIKAHLFLSSRIYGKEKNAIEKLVQKVIDKFFGHQSQITKMSSFQIKAANHVMKKQTQIYSERKIRWDMIDAVCEKHHHLNNAMPKGSNSLAFKYVINANTHESAFEAYLKLHHIPFYCLGKDIGNAEKLSLANFKKFAKSFFEISCEASIPIAEIKRVAALIAQFKP